MSTITVHTKEEFEKALKEGYDKIFISDDLAQKMEPLKEVSALSKKKKALLVSAITTSLAAVIATVTVTLAAAPGTAGASLLLGGPVLVGEVAALGASTGVSVSVIAGIVIACAALGSEIVIEILKRGEIKESTTTIEFPDGSKVEKKCTYFEKKAK